MDKPLRLAVFALVAVLAAVAGMTLARWIQGTPATAGADTRALVLQAPRALPDFLLTDHEQRPFGPARLQGRWTLLFFGFTHCPDVCPTTLNTLAGLAQALEDLPPALQPSITMVSVDPMRDTAEVLSTYVPFFDPDFVGVTGEMGEVLTPDPRARRRLRLPTGSKRRGLYGGTYGIGIPGRSTRPAGRDIQHPAPGG